MSKKSGLLTMMEKAARKAGGKLRRDFGEVEHLQVSQKGPADFVSKADQRAERTIYDELLKARPGIGFLMEEGGEIAPDSAEQGRFIVDPLDGTSNFLHGIPHFAISIAAQERNYDGSWGEIIAALVYQPMTDESFWAEKARGAWLGERRLRVSARRDMNESLIATGIPYMGHGNFGEWSRIFGAIAPEVAGIRRFGAASLDLAWLAAGRYDGFWETGLSPWDTAAGCLLVREAGGFVTDFRGRSPIIADAEVLAGNDAIHSKMHKLLVGALRNA